MQSSRDWQWDWISQGNLKEIESKTPLQLNISRYSQKDQIRHQQDQGIKWKPEAKK